MSVSSAYSHWRANPWTRDCEQVHNQDLTFQAQPVLTGDEKSEWGATMLNDTIAFWSQHDSMEAFAAVDSVLGEIVRCRLRDKFKGHHILHIGYPLDFDLSPVECRLRQ